MTDVAKPSSDDVDFQPEAADPAEPLMVVDSSEVELAAAPIIGGILTEDSIAVTTIGLDPEVIESAAAGVIPAILSVARQEGTRFLHLSLPASLATTLADALQKVGFKKQETVQYLLDTGVENGVRRITQ